MPFRETRCLPARTAGRHVRRRRRRGARRDCQPDRQCRSSILERMPGSRWTCSRGIGNRVAVPRHGQGPGIPKPELKQIFKRFYRVPGPWPSRVKGTGLGLYIVRSVAKRHGGRAWAESEGPGGAARSCGASDGEMTRYPGRVKTSSTWRRVCASIWKPKGYPVDAVGAGEAAFATVFLGRKPAQPAFDRRGAGRHASRQGRLHRVSEMREAGQFVPTLMLTARGRPEDVLAISPPARTIICPTLRALHPDRAHSRPAAR